MNRSTMPPPTSGAIRRVRMRRSWLAASWALLSMVMAGLVACSTTTPQSESQSLAETLADSGTRDSGTTDAGAACEAGRIQCSGDTPQTCADNGRWVSGTACGGSDPTCVDGTCHCVPGTTRCEGEVPDGGEAGDVGDGVKTCESTGTWSKPWPCATDLCAEGSCTGVTANDSSPSCAPGGAGMTTCPAGTGSESCCASQEVAGGTYYRAYDYGDAGATHQTSPATVSGLRLDKYLVTVGRFRQFANAVLPPGGGAGWLPAEHAGVHTHLNGGRGLVNVGATSADGGVAYEHGWEQGWDGYSYGHVDPTNANLSCNDGFATWTDTPGNNENLPMNCETWYEAYAFCIWDGGFLPSEAEWGYAAAGGSQQRKYPWGATAPGTESEYAISGNLYQGTPPMHVASVGTATLGTGRWGQLDLAGELFEWTLDLTGNYVDPCTDCSVLSPTAPNRVTRGSPFYASVPDPFASTRGDLEMDDRTFYDGFRCARTP